LPRYLLVPGTWINDVAVITRMTGAMLTIGRIPVSDGVHVLDAGDTPFGVIIVGHDEWGSYAYLDGTGTGKINPNPAD
jgi:hypothetical protein